MERTATLALGLRSTPQSLGVIGRGLGLFEAEGVDLQIARSETAGPRGVRGLIDGEYHFAELGAVPAVQAALEGHDPLILFAAEPVSALYVLGARSVERAQALAGASIGVLSRAGQTGASALAMLERWGMAGHVELVELGTYPKIYDALSSGAIRGGVLTADYLIAGRTRHGLSVLADLGNEFRFQGPVLATTKHMRDADPDLVQRVTKGYLGSLRRFKTDAAAVVPLLVEHLGFVDAGQAEDIRRFYAERFQDRPFASDEGIERVIASFADRHAAAQTMKASDIVDHTFMTAALLQRHGD